MPGHLKKAAEIFKKIATSTAAKITVGFLGASTELSEAAIFIGIAANKLLTELFGVLGGTATATTIVNLPSALLSKDKSPKDKAISLVACGPTTLLFYALFIAESSTAPLLFSFVVSSDWVITTVDLGLKKYYGEKIPPASSALYINKTLKVASILGILIDPGATGTGAAIKAAAEGEGNLMPRIAAGAAGAFATIGSGASYYRTGQLLFAASKKETSHPDYSNVPRDIEMQPSASPNIA